MQNISKKIGKVIFIAACIVLLATFNIYINTGKRLANRFQSYFLQHIISNKIDALPKFLGVPSQQFPSDNWIAQEIIYEIKPDFILEIGTGQGGTALFYATILEKVNEQGKVITVSTQPLTEEEDPTEMVTGQNSQAKACEYKIWKEKITFIKGDAEDPGVVDMVVKMIGGRKVFILLDSKKTKSHVLHNLIHYAGPVAAGSYIMIHDTAIEPLVNAAVQEFVNANHNFQIDHSREKFLITLSPSGFLKKIETDK